LIDILDTVLQIAKDIPPVDNKLSRFGNPAFKTFYDKILEVSLNADDTDDSDQWSYTLEYQASQRRQFPRSRHISSWHGETERE